jgi:hypothetical protein
MECGTCSARCHVARVSSGQTTRKDLPGNQRGVYREYRPRNADYGNDASNHPARVIDRSKNLRSE